MIWDDVSYHNKHDKNCNYSVQTPNIDAMINSIGGIELNQYYAQSVCTPSRSALMTGGYPIHNGLERLLEYRSEKGLPLTETTIAQILKKYSPQYDTHIVGKWHLGVYVVCLFNHNTTAWLRYRFIYHFFCLGYRKWAYTPTYRGFDHFYGHYCGSQDHFSHTVQSKYDFRQDNRCGLYHGDDKETNSSILNAICSRVVKEAKGIYSNFLYNDYIFKY